MLWLSYHKVKAPDFSGVLCILYREKFMALYKILEDKTDQWRAAGYPVEKYSVIAEILNYAWLEKDRTLRFLRHAQMRALETYWYLRLVEKTPLIPELYKRYFPKLTARLNALGLQHEDLRDFVMDNGFPALLEQIKTDDAFVKQYRLEALRETLDLDYPSYILALAMGAGKTILIAAIIATEFAMSLEYPHGEFVQNALVFAPGKTILGALRELADVPFDRILPPRLHRQFITNYKLTFTPDGTKDIPVTRKSAYNIIVTNTEKIRIQKRPVRRGKVSQLRLKALEQESIEVANLRLQTIASLPNLGIFSDEAHHTYGQAMEKGLKRVRQTVNYLHQNTDVLCVVNTTGTPYYKRQLLKDVVVWYSLSEGIRDGILKEVAGNVFAYSFGDSDIQRFVQTVVEDFFNRYGNVSLPDGSKAKLAMYFPQEADLQAMRPVVEGTLIQMGYSPDIVLRNTSKSPQAELDSFAALNNPESPHRVVLLVNKGTEGWNCPSLFATALARKLRRSNNFVLQAATRCLRQVPGNAEPASIYLSMDNVGTLNAQLQETYGETLRELEVAKTRAVQVTLTVRTAQIPPLIVERIIRTVVPKQQRTVNLPALTVPQDVEIPTMTRQQMDLADTGDGSQVLQFIKGETITVDDTLDVYAAATELAAIYRVDVKHLLHQLHGLYPDGELPAAHLPALNRQMEKQLQGYEIQEQTIQEALALLRLEGFDKEVDEQGNAVYTATIAVPIDRMSLLVEYAKQHGHSRNLSFHYTPYNFDSSPERTFFTWLLKRLDIDPDDVQDFLFTGGLTPGKQSDFFVEYLSTDGLMHRYVPDFLIRKKDGRCLIVEIKDARWADSINTDLQNDAQGQEAVSVEGRKAVAVRRWANLDPDRLSYQLIFAKDETLPHDSLSQVNDFLYPTREDEQEQA